MAHPPSPPAPDSDETRYQESERQAMDRWQALDPEALAKRQMDREFIPGWLNAPEWAQWVHYCSSRGWVFLSEDPHVFGDGHVSGHASQLVPANQVPGVLFHPNRRHYLGQGAPHWVCDRRRALAGAGGAPKPKAAPR